MAYVWLLVFLTLGMTAAVTVWALVSIVREERRNR